MKWIKRMNNRICYICGKPKHVEWYSLWYDGKPQDICSSMCRETLVEICLKNPDKTYSGMMVK